MHLRSTMKGLVVVAAAALAMTACGSTSSGTTTTTAASGSSTTTGPTGGSTTTTAAPTKFLACEVTDTGGINDRSFNASAYAGLQVAAKAVPGITYRFLSSTSTSDYVPNINTFIADKCGIIITVGFDMAQATQNAAKAHPTQDFAIVDNTYTPAISNILGLFYNTAQDAFLGGYLAAAMSTSGKVGTFGGQDIPPVTIYMDGWVAGVRYFDQKNHKDVVALGWKPQAGRAAGSLNGSGLFTNDFTNQGLGKTDAQTLIAQGADIIFPVAGSVGLGAAAAVKQAGGSNYMEWVDTDGCISALQYCSLFITSVTKGIVASVSQVVEAAAKGQFKGGNYNGTLANNGVSLAPFHDFASKIPASVQTELGTLKAGIIAGTISVDPTKYPVPAGS
jgi:basic membrane protein A